LKSQNILYYIKLETQWAEPVPLTCRFVLRKLYAEPYIGASYQNINKFGQNGFREDLLIGQLQTRTAFGGHISCMIGTKYAYFVQDPPCIIPRK